MKKALVIIDMQNDFVSGSLKNAQAEAIVSAIANYAKSFDGDVIATRDTHGENYLSTPEGAHLPVVHCVHGSHGWEICDEIMQVLNARNALLLDKPTFGSLNWDCLKDYTHIELVGTCTDICVVSNALIIKALFPAMEMKVHANLCAGVTPQSHEAGLSVMQSCQIEIVK